MSPIPPPCRIVHVATPSLTPRKPTPQGQAMVVVPWNADSAAGSHGSTCICQQMCVCVSDVRMCICQCAHVWVMCVRVSVNVCMCEWCTCVCVNVWVDMCIDTVFCVCMLPTHHILLVFFVCVWHKIFLLIINLYMYHKLTNYLVMNIFLSFK